MPKEAAKKRDRKKELVTAKEGLALRVGDIAAARRDGTLGEEYIKLAQALIMCTLPYSQTEERQIVRTARLGDGTNLEVTFSAILNGVALPYGVDRRLLAWVLDRAVRTNDAFVSISSAREYLEEMGLPLGGKSNKELAQRFERLSGLSIGIRRRDAIATYTVIAKNNLPNSVAVRTIEAGQTSLPGLEKRHGIQINTDLFNDIKTHNVVLPRLLWLGLNGSMRVTDIALWLIVRCFAANSTTVIPWKALREQFASINKNGNSQDTDTNPRRFKIYVREAITILGQLWPESPIVEVDDGIQVTRASEPLLPDDASKNRIRRKKD